MAVEVKLKGKYRVPKPYGRYRGGHNDSNKKVKRPGAGNSKPYEPQKHVLCLKEGRKLVWHHER